MITEINTPTKLQLVEGWLQEHFMREPCIIFFEPIEDRDRPEQIGEYLGLGARAVIRIEECDVFVHPVDEDELTELVNGASVDVYGRVAGWDGDEIVIEND